MKLPTLAVHVGKDMRAVIYKKSLKLSVYNFRQTASITNGEKITIDGVSTAEMTCSGLRKNLV